uniref:Uncharacterized protein n=1 Tax=Rhodnius prolixus TaxID=13249 RepID=T1HEV4_RHOPR
MSYRIRLFGMRKTLKLRWIRLFEKTLYLCSY